MVKTKKLPLDKTPKDLQTNVILNINSFKSLFNNTLLPLQIPRPASLNQSSGW